MQRNNTEKFAIQYAKAKELVATGMSVSDACGKIGISNASYYRAKRIEAGLPAYGTKANKALMPANKKPSTSVVTSGRKTTARKAAVPRLVHLTVPESPALNGGEVTVAIVRMPMALLKDFFSTNY